MYRKWRISGLLLNLFLGFVSVFRYRLRAAAVLRWDWGNGGRRAVGWIGFSGWNPKGNALKD